MKSIESIGAILVGAVIYAFVPQLGFIGILVMAVGVWHLLDIL